VHLFEQQDKKMLFTLLVSIALTVGYLYPYSNSFALSIAIPFSFRPVRFPLSGFFNLDDLRAVTHDFRA
jgi:hypothetical protein